ncbi:hypothetical protein I4U23_029813 [Adineta vaga]|nr:hypothetical protein I4U23_029813 [Adineta vaga]
MSASNPSGNQAYTKSYRMRRSSKQTQNQATATNVQLPTTTQSFPYEVDFPSIQSATSVSSSTREHSTVSTVPEQQSFTQKSSTQFPSDIENPTPTPSMALNSPAPQSTTGKKHKVLSKPIANRIFSNKSFPNSVLQQMTTTTFIQNSKLSTIHYNNRTMSTQQITRPLTSYEDQINKKLCEIILTIHESKEFVSRERVQRELFNFYHVDSWHKLGVQASRFNAFINLTDRQKDVTFYMNIFEQIFNLCTLNDLDVLLARFLKVESYADLRLGPLNKNPDVQRIFAYHPTNSNEPVPKITTGQVIQRFMDFLKENRHKRPTPFDDFLDQLVKKYQLQSREELGIYCKSFPFLLQVISSVRRDHDWHIRQAQEQVQQVLIEDIRVHLTELRDKMRDELELSAFNKKNTPTALFNYLISIVHNYLDFIPQQPAVRKALTQLRDNELIRCLFNVSIYLGTLDKPETFIPELKKLYGYQDGIVHPQTITLMEQLPLSNKKMSKKERKKMEAMLQQQQQKLASQSSEIEPNDQHTTIDTASSIPVNTSFACSLFTSHQKKSKPTVSLAQLCSDIYTFLVRYDTVLTIKQLLKIEQRLCTQHDFISFLDKYRHTIDPRKELSVYEHISSINNREELYSFIQQLSAINNNDVNLNEEQQSNVLIHGDVRADQLHLNTENISAVEKAIKHKFPEFHHDHQGSQMIRKAKQQYHKNKQSIIRFEESVLDVNGLNHLNVCPTSFNVNELQLCQLILHCPSMIDIPTWFQWLYCFQPKHGTFKSFIHKHQNTFKDLHLLETSTGELYRIPNYTTLDTFERELHALHIRSAVGHLCALIFQEGLITRFSFNVYRTSMGTWFRFLRTLEKVQNDQINPMQCILDFITYLPVLIGQSRIIEELILGPLDDVFGNDCENNINVRIRIWNLANMQQRTKLELFGYMINIVEWKNEEKWLNQVELEEQFEVKITDTLLQKDNINRNHSIESSIIHGVSPIVSKVEESTSLSVIPIINYTDDEKNSSKAAFEHIESIRRGFGVDSTLDSTGQSIVSNLQGMIERSLEKLSTDLYSDQGHFVLELIQNADDNQYSSECLPTLRFILAKERILVCNNEIGFQASNISAICNVGASTKGKHKQGYAGHKGIGFKSVFMISHRPEIHSRNYHIRFDTINGTKQIGYIRPIWLDQYEEILPNSDEWTTCIRLPLKQETRHDRLERNFKDIQAKLLLFLNRLRQIEIINEQSGSITRVFTRIDHAQGQIIELQEKMTNESVINNFWLVVKKVIDVPTHIKEKLRDIKGEVDSTTIAVAYPLNKIQESSNQPLPTQPLFAYLPLRSYGFRFILQADFEIPATRQEIRRDNLWNEWLKTEMTCLLSLAYLQFKRLPDLLVSSSIDTHITNHLTPIHAIKYFLKLIPSRNELDSYFNAFVDESIQLLTGIIELPIVRQNEKEESIIDWVSPSKCMIIRDPHIRKILSQDLLIAHFNSYYVHEQLVVVNLILPITRLIEISYQQNEQERPKTTSSIEQIAQWLVCLDYSLEQQRKQIYFDHDHNEKNEEDTITKLKQMKILPIKQHSRLMSVNEFNKYSISFPLDKSIRFSKHLKLVLDDMPTLDEQLLNIIEDKYPRQLDSIKRLLRKLGITEGHNIREIYRQQMLPIMSDSSRWSSKSDSVLMAYLMCIYEYIYLEQREKNFENELKTMQNNIIIKTRGNTFVSLGSSDVIVHLTSKYGCRKSLESLKLPKYQFIFISDDYYTEYHTQLLRTENDMRSFVSFLKELNMSDFLQMNFKDEYFVKVSELATTKWVYSISRLSEQIDEPFIIKDCSCQEFDKLISTLDENNIDDLDLCGQLLQYLNNQYQHTALYYSASVCLAYTYKHNPTPISGVESSFCLSVRQHAWIPVVGGKLFKPNDVYLLSSDNQTSAFRRYVPHLDESKVSLNNTDFISNILGIKRYVSHRTMFELLMKWACDLDMETLWNLVNQTNTSDAIPCTLPNTFRQSCLDTIDNFHLIYQYLASNDETRHLMYQFRLWPLIFIPRNQNTGDFLFAHQTFWNDPLSLLSSQDTKISSSDRISLQSYYRHNNNNPSLQSFFLDIFGVEFQPAIDDYIPLLSIIQDYDKIWQIIEIITELTIKQDKHEEIREKLLNLSFIPCMNENQKLMKYTDHPFYPHDTNIVNLFVDILSIIKLPSFDIVNEFKKNFCILFNIEDLDDIIQTKVHVENEQLSTNLSDFYRHSIDLIQHFLLDHSLISDTRSTDLSTIFARMQFLCVDHIQLSYCYGSNIIKTPPTSYNIDTYVDRKSCKFYILKKYENSEMRYIDAMVDFIVENETARSKLLTYIRKLVQIYQNNVEHGLDQLRESLKGNYEPKWFISEIAKKNVPSVLPKEEKETKVIEKPVITNEQIEQLSNEPTRRPKPRPKEVPNEEDANRLTSFPLRASVIESDEPSPAKSTSKIQSKSKSDNFIVEKHVSTLHMNEHDSQISEDHEHRTRKTNNNKHLNDQNQSESNDDNKTLSEDRFLQPHAPIVFSDPVLLPAANFERINVSNLIDLFESSSSSSLLTNDSSITIPCHPIGNEADILTGRQGEEFVFNYLKWKYPKESIEWLNETTESGAPYDIRIIIRSDNDRIEYIEVKTTRTSDQNTFLVSISEVEYLLQHSSNYFIYRVYYADNRDLSTITVINKIKDNLQKKHLKLSMTIVSKSND